MRAQPEGLELSAASMFAKMLSAGLLLVACAVCAGANARLKTPERAASSRVVITSNATILLTEGEPGPFEEAAKDPQDDFAKVLGKKLRIVRSSAEASSATIWIGGNSKLPEDVRPKGLAQPESFSISIVEFKGKPIPGKAVLLAGADMRGTIYAIYEFSREYLGVDPLYYWTDHVPGRRTEIALAANLNKEFLAPVLKL